MRSRPRLPPIDSDPTVEKIREDSHEQTTEAVRKKASQANYNGHLPLPENLPVEEVHIYPADDYFAMVCIGQEVTDELEIQPARLYIKRYIRHKYAPAGGGAPCIGALLDRVIDKGIAGPGLLATILVDKYADHLPLYCQRQRFAREGIPIAQSTLDEWASQAMDRLEIIWDHLASDTKAAGICRSTNRRLRHWKAQKELLPPGLVLGLPQSDRKNGAFGLPADPRDALSEYLHDGLLEIDNNLVENTIRPLALGRKNYLLPDHTKGPGEPLWSIPCWEPVSCTG